jgi:hypothetical protein
MQLPFPGEILLELTFEYPPVWKLLTSFSVPLIIRPFSIVYKLMIPAGVLALAMTMTTFPEAFVLSLISPSEGALSIVRTSDECALVA